MRRCSTPLGVKLAEIEAPFEPEGGAYDHGDADRRNPKAPDRRFSATCPSIRIIENPDASCMVGRRQFLHFGTAALAAPALLRLAHAQQPPVVLKLHHFLSPVAYAHTRFLTPWAKSVEKDSGGRIRIDLFPSMQLGGTAPQLYDQAVNGTADIVWTLPGMTPGRFPRIEVFELPFVADKRAVANARAVQQLYETRLRDEFKEVQPICVWAHDQGVLHTNKPVNAA